MLVLQAWDETPWMRGLRIDLGAARIRHTQPGQVLKLHLPEGDGFFALATAPGGGPAELLVARGGTVADAVIAAAAPGARLEMTAPFGAGFPLAKAEGHDLLLFAAGSGIAPIRAVAQHVGAHRARFGAVALYYGQREAADFAYRAEHAAHRAAGISVVLCASRGVDEGELVAGHVQDVAAARRLEGIAPDGAVAFLCGPSAMVSAARDTLAGLGIARDRTFLNF